MSKTTSDQDPDNWVGTVRALGPGLASRAAAHDSDDSFVAENYALLKERGLFAAGVPAELGGGGAAHAELCALIRELARSCSATGLAVSMHTHLVGTLAYLWRKGNPAPENLLRRVAAESLVLVSTGGSDWLSGSGKLERVTGGYRLTGRKIFGSGVPAAQLLLTTGVLDDPEQGATVVHLAVPLDAPGVTVLDTWRALGMRGSGSHDVQLEGVFVPEAATGVRRPAGQWHPFMHTVVLAALPIFYSAYVGVAEAMHTAALDFARRRPADPAAAEILAELAGELHNQLVTVHLAIDGMVALAASQPAGAETTSAMLAHRTILVKALLGLADKALELAGGRCFYRDQPLERLFRDIQGARFHPVPEKVQIRYTGNHLLGRSG